MPAKGKKKGGGGGLTEDMISRGGGEVRLDPKRSVLSMPTIAAERKKGRLNVD